MVHSLSLQRMIRTYLIRSICVGDQIWFTEKDATEASGLYSLLDFKVRNDRDIENDYINGRYGAIPFIR